MTKFVLIVAALVASAVVASPVINAGNSPGILEYPNDIDWTKYLDDDNVDPTNVFPPSGNLNNVNNVGNDPADKNNRLSDCGPTEEYKDFAGMKEWCVANCFHNPSYCPPTHCRCW